MVMDEEKPMEAWIASVRDIAHRLKAADFEVKDIDLIITLTQGLPDRFDPFIVSLDATPIDQLNVDSVIARLLNEESRQGCNDPGTDITLIAHSKLPKKTWSKPSKAKSVINEDQSSRGPRCYNCGGHGHLARNCSSPKQEGEKANFATKDNDASSLYSDTSY
jgi:hypothetical protein